MRRKHALQWKKGGEHMRDLEDQSKNTGLGMKRKLQDLN